MRFSMKRFIWLLFVKTIIKKIYLEKMSDTFESFYALEKEIENWYTS